MSTLMILGGGFLLVLATGINAIYSIGGVCLDILDPAGRNCSYGYDALPDSLQSIVNFWLYVIAAAMIGAGATVISRANRDRIVKPN